MASEFDLIAAFARPFRPAAAPRGPGGVCAVLAPATGNRCVSTEAIVEGVHFSLDFAGDERGRGLRDERRPQVPRLRVSPDARDERTRFTLEDVGHKALAVNLSDLA